MDSKYYQFALEQVALGLHCAEPPVLVNVRNCFPDFKMEDPRFTIRGFVCYLVIENEKPTIAVSQGKSLPFRLLKDLLMILRPVGLFEDFVVDEYTRVHSEAVVALTAVKSVHEELTAAMSELNDDSISWFISQIQGQRTISAVSKCIDEIVKLSTAAVKSTVVN